MWGFTVYLMHLADYLTRRKYKIQCRVCGRDFENNGKLVVHTKTDHAQSLRTDLSNALSTIVTVFLALVLFVI